MSKIVLYFTDESTSVLLKEDYNRWYEREKKAKPHLWKDQSPLLKDLEWDKDVAVLYAVDPDELMEQCRNVIEDAILWILTKINRTCDASIRHRTFGVGNSPNLHSLIDSCTSFLYEWLINPDNADLFESPKDERDEDFQVVCIFSNLQRFFPIINGTEHSEMEKHFAAKIRRLSHRIRT